MITPTSSHGTRTRYVGGCRCEACTRANTEYAATVRPIHTKRRSIEREIPLAGEWIEDAACFGVNGDLFFDERPGNDGFWQAIAICNECPVRLKCLDHALTVGEDHGVWGGVTPKERRRIRRKRTA